MVGDEMWDLGLFWWVLVERFCFFGFWVGFWKMVVLGFLVVLMGY
jgi:hypothetical protein